MCDVPATPWSPVLWRIVRAGLTWHARPNGKTVRVVSVLLVAMVALILAASRALAIHVRFRAPGAIGGIVASDFQVRVARLEQLDLVTRQAMLPNATHLLAPTCLQIRHN